LTQHMDVFLRDFVGYGEDKIKILDIEWETVDEALNTGYGAPELAGRPVLVYQDPDGGVVSKMRTTGAVRRCWLTFSSSGRSSRDFPG
jgi:hypothetical protein